MNSGRILLLLLCISAFMYGCKKKDEDIIIGKWQSDRDWFEYKKDKTYSSGKDDMKMVDNFKYTMDDEKKELNMYTDMKSKTFYLRYEFKGNDTLAVRNVMSTDTTMIHFIRVK